MATEVKLPELGENVEKGDVIRVMVKAGDTIAVDQPVLELETDKATIEVPSSAGGKVAEVRVKAGDKVTVGQTVLVVEAGGNGAGPQAAAKGEGEEKPEAAGAEAPRDTAPEAPPAKDQPGQDEATRSTHTPAPPDTRTAGKPAGSVVEFASARPAQRAEPAAVAAPARGAEPSPAASAPAAPSVRRFARELGVDITAVSGSGPGGRINQDDVKAHVKGAMSSGGGLRRPAAALPDFSKWGEVEARPMSNIRRKTAEHLSIAWQAPHVTQHDQADVTELEAFRARSGPRVEKAGGKLTITAILIKICALALDRFPQFASSVDMAGEAIVFKKYRHIGVAVDTPNGLLVPVIRDADRKSLTEIAVELGSLSQKARDRKLSLDEMAGGVFSISNLGGIGGTSFTPIINQPEVAILGVSRGGKQPVWDADAGAFVPREMLPLSLSYDHRVIDGADAARFLRYVAEALEHPLALYL
jgi:pyruvate dehydrogenase E2 component (dihydrolipoamide acetyltransferase)